MFKAVHPMREGAACGGRRTTDAGSLRAVAWQAETHAGVRGGWYVARGPLVVPRRWTAWLLMNDAGVPAMLIAREAGLSPAHVSRRIRAARALMAWPPFGDYVTACGAAMPRWDGRQDSRPEPAKGEACGAAR